MKRFSRTLALMMAVCLTMVTLVACNGNQGDPSAKKELKDSLVWAQSSDVFSFDPNIGKETTAIQVTGNIYDTLLTVDENMELQPMLAESWKQVDDVTYTFDLRKDVKFHDGTPFTNYVDSCDKGQHDMCLQNWTTSTADGDYTYFALYHSSKFGSQGNRVMKTIPGIDPILEQAKASDNPDERVRLYGEAEKILTAHSVNRPLMFVDLVAGSTNKVEGFKMMPNSYHKLYQVKAYK